jgi:hypothetical protein
MYYLKVSQKWLCCKLIKQQFTMLIKHGRLLIKHGRLLIKHGRLLIKHGRLLIKHGRLLFHLYWLSVLSLLTYHQFCIKRNAKGAATAFTSGTSPVFPGFHVAESLVFCIVFHGSLLSSFMFSSFRHCIVCSSSFSAYHHPCGIQKVIFLE